MVDAVLEDGLDLVSLLSELNKRGEELTAEPLTTSKNCVGRAIIAAFKLQVRNFHKLGGSDASIEKSFDCSAVCLARRLVSAGAHARPAHAEAGASRQALDGDNGEAARGHGGRDDFSEGRQRR